MFDLLPAKLDSSIPDLLFKDQGKSVLNEPGCEHVLSLQHHPPSLGWTLSSQVHTHIVLLSAITAGWCYNKPIPPHVLIYTVSLDINLSKISPSDFLSSVWAWTCFICCFYKKKKLKDWEEKKSWKTSIWIFKHSWLQNEFIFKLIDPTNSMICFLTQFLRVPFHTWIDTLHGD